METRRKGWVSSGVIVCLNTRSGGARGEADVDPKRVAIEVSRILLPLRPSHPLPPSLELYWGGETKIWNHISLHIPGRIQPSPGYGR